MSAGEAKDLTAARKRYAEKIRQTANLKSELVVNAFAEVPRERYMPPGPWKIIEPGSIQSGKLGYRDTPDNDPIHLYEDVLIAIDPQRGLNNGMPSGLARWIDRMEVVPGERVVHVGCGTGYYSAILGHIVGAGGHVTAIELDDGLARTAADNLAPLANVTVVNGDGTSYAPGLSDVIFINAGATHPCGLWLDSLKPGGRLMFPLTPIPLKPPGPQDPAESASRTRGPIEFGVMIKSVRRERGHDAETIGGVGIFPCIGARDEDASERLREALGRGGHEGVKSLRRERHERETECWLHGDGWCFSTRALV